jgi:hypothetical protein
VDLASGEQVAAAHSAIRMAFWNAISLCDEVVDDRGDLSSNLVDIARSSLELWEVLCPDYAHAGKFRPEMRAFREVASSDRGCAHSSALDFTRDIVSTVRATVGSMREPYDFVDFVEALPRLRDALRQRANPPDDLMNRMEVEFAKATRASRSGVQSSLPHNDESRPVTTPAAAKPDGAPALKQPSEEAFMAYRMLIATGASQQDIAERMQIELGITVCQGTVSRWLKQSTNWITAGNVLPDFPGLSKKPESIDPSQIDLGPRQDGRTPRQRSRNDD